MPKHVAIIMDGNGRWAKERGWIRLQGHKEGARSVKRVLEASWQLGLKYLTLFAFSAQNWERPEPEVQGLMGLLLEYLHSERRELLRRGIRFRAIGEIERLPQNLQDEITRLTELSALVRRSAEDAAVVTDCRMGARGHEEAPHFALPRGSGQPS